MRSGGPPPLVQLETVMKHVGEIVRLGRPEVPPWVTATDLTFGQLRLLFRLPEAIDLGGERRSRFGQPAVDHAPVVVAVLTCDGRKHAAGEDPDEVGLDDALLRRYGGQAGIVGRFPTQSVLDKVRRRDGHRCQYQGCHAGEAAEVDYSADDPDLKRRPRAEDLRTLCTSHHQSESRRRFVGAPGRIAHTAPATWARIEADEPLVLRDNQLLWPDRASLLVLRAWPLAFEETRGDLERWIQVLGEARSEVHGAAGGDQPDPVAQLNAALDHLGLPRRRQERLVRAIHALVLTPAVDELSRETLRETLDRGGS
jgi:hypothetical protein